MQSTVNWLLKCRHPAWFFIIWWYLKSVYTDHHTNCKVLLYILLSCTSVDRMKVLRCPKSNLKEQEDGGEEERCRKAYYYQSLCARKQHRATLHHPVCVQTLIALWLPECHPTLSASPAHSGELYCGPLSCPKAFLDPWNAISLSYLSLSNFHSKISIPLGPLSIFPTGT